MKQFDVIVIGGGHAGCEAAAAAARVGALTALVTLKADAIGRLSCNPAVGGIGKGHLVREIDALDGLMGKVADAAGIQFRLLNRSRGPAVRGPRAQVDRAVYANAMRAALGELPVLVIEGETVDIIVDPSPMVSLADGRNFCARAVVLTTGTFLGGVIHLGDERWPAGRMGEAAATRLASRLRAHLPIARLKTGTPPRLSAKSIDFSGLDTQPGDTPPVLFSALSASAPLPQRACHMTHTTPTTHAIIREALHRSALYAGHIKGVGPRYCPSIEDKVVRFADRTQHQVFLEPEGLDSNLIYPNGISNSLPREVQETLVRSMPGCAHATIVQPGYAIEYDMVDPRALKPTLEVAAFPGLFLAGQINGTTGYEEAAAQGLLAGLNAALLAGDGEPVTVQRDQAYLGVMVDDLVQNGADEPYRMFTSRAEHRLMLRADNAGDRLAAWGDALGLIGSERRAHTAQRSRLKAEASGRLSGLRLTPTAARAAGVAMNQDGRHRTGHELLAHDGAGWPLVDRLDPWFTALDDGLREHLYAEALYSPFAARTASETASAAAQDALPLPSSLIGMAVPGLSNELSEKLARLAPKTLGEARRISGMTPAGLALIAAHARRLSPTGRAA